MRDTLLKRAHADHLSHRFAGRKIQGQATGYKKVAFFSSVRFNDDHLFKRCSACIMSSKPPTGIGLNDLLEAQTSDHGMCKDDMAASYNTRKGGCNTLLADHLISLIQPFLPPAHQPLRILDNACGPAVVTTRCFATRAITNHAALHSSAVDISPDCAASNHSLIAQDTKLGLERHARRDTAAMDGTILQFAADTFDASFTSLAISAFQDPVKGASELRRTLKPGGVAAPDYVQGRRLATTVL